MQDGESAELRTLNLHCERWRFQNKNMRTADERAICKQRKHQMNVTQSILC